jgi:hypothetical protein
MTRKRPKVTEEDIARRAYEISQSDDNGTEEENWLRAERELRGEKATQPDAQELATAN